MQVFLCGDILLFVFYKKKAEPIWLKLMSQYYVAVPVHTY